MPSSSLGMPRTASERGVASGRSGPNQRWRLPSVWRSIPAFAIRSRRLRWRGGRRVRTGRTPPSARIRRRVRSADLADREVQDTGRLLGRESAAQDVVENVEPLLRSGVQGDRLPRFHTIEGDKITGRLAGDTFTGRPHEESRPLTGASAAATLTAVHM